ncbi:MAG TPA: IS5 family transposase [Anaerolineae bacterium]|nr:IS5 family transposase [Anaerolineae bacterium]
MAIQPKREPYPSDLSDAEWEIIKPFLPSPKAKGRPRVHPLREILNAIFYIVRSGCVWRMLPHDFPPWKTVYHYFRLWREDGTWEQINAALRAEVRVAAGRDPEPSAGILDSQSVKTTETPGPRGYDAAKKINGRKRHILVDTMGLLLMVVVHVASLQDRDGAKLVLEKIRGRFPRLQLIWADSAYAGMLVDWVKRVCHLVLEIVKRPAGVKGFQVLPRRWVVERTLGWLGRYRRLSKDYEALPESSEAMVYMAMIHLMLRRLGRHPPGTGHQALAEAAIA